MRGKVRLLYHRGEFFRITPAYAGKSRAIPSRSRRFWDHPRLCGEKLNLARNSGLKEGSPPPMRGKVSKENVPVLINGITPAYAGKRHQVPECQQRIWDHPRLCGEKLSQSPEAFNGTGSPPPMRGKVSGESPAKAECGITPAYAGKSSRSV